MISPILYLLIGVFIVAASGVRLTALMELQKNSDAGEKSKPLCMEITAASLMLVAGILFFFKALYAALALSDKQEKRFPLVVD